MIHCLCPAGYTVQSLEIGAFLAPRSVVKCNKCVDSGEMLKMCHSLWEERAWFIPLKKAQYNLKWPQGTEQKVTRHVVSIGEIWSIQVFFLYSCRCEGYHVYITCIDVQYRKILQSINFAPWHAVCYLAPTSYNYANQILYLQTGNVINARNQIHTRRHLKVQ